MSPWFLIASVCLLPFLWLCWLTIRAVSWSISERRRRKHKQRIGGDISEALRRECMFFDDQMDPWRWVG